MTAILCNRASLCEAHVALHRFGASLCVSRFARTLIAVNISINQRSAQRCLKAKGRRVIPTMAPQG